MFLRPAALSDIDNLAELENQLFENGINEHSLSIEMEFSRITVVGTPVCGYLIARFGTTLIDILRVGVHPDFRRRGIARSLLEETISRAYLPIILTVNCENAPARTLYASLGFRPVSYVPQSNALILYRSGVDVNCAPQVQR